MPFFFSFFPVNTSITRKRKGKPGTWNEPDFKFSPVKFYIAINADC